MLIYEVTLSTDDGELMSSIVFDDYFISLASQYAFNVTFGYQSDTYYLTFSGLLADMNTALAALEFKPDCPFTTGGQTINILVLAYGSNDSPASGQMVSVATGEATEVKGYGVTTVID